MIHRAEHSTLYGTPAVPGLACAPAMWAKNAPLPSPPDCVVAPHERDAHVERYRQAALQVSEVLGRLAHTARGSAADVLAAQAAMAIDPGLDKMVCRAIEQGAAAERATADAIDAMCAIFDRNGGLMAERTADLRNLCARMLAALSGSPQPGIVPSANAVVLLAEDLAPADAASLDPEHVHAVVTHLGAPSSHTSIIARELGIPCVVGVDNLNRFAEGKRIFVDGTRGLVTDDISEDALGRLADERASRCLARQWKGPGRLASGESVELLANAYDGTSARAAADSAACGIGLFRTELCFADWQREPSVEEQAAAYAEAFEAFEGAKVVMRTFDAGADKPLPWAGAAHEDNPALGVRGVRNRLIDEGIMLRQLDAIGAAHTARPASQHWVMAPMVSTVAEARWICGLIRQRGLGAGIMVEVPAVAIGIERFLDSVDFVSIGTNDLAQYVMAADRMNPALASYGDPWQPDVLALIDRVAKAGHNRGIPVGVCGQAAADPLFACVLVGMGVTSLSMAASAIGAVGVQLEQATLSSCRHAAKAALASDDPGDARDAARRHIVG